MMMTFYHCHHPSLTYNVRWIQAVLKVAPRYESFSRQSTVFLVDLTRRQMWLNCTFMRNTAAYS